MLGTACISAFVWTVRTVAYEAKLLLTPISITWRGSDISNVCVIRKLGDELVPGKMFECALTSKPTSEFLKLLCTRLIRRTLILRPVSTLFLEWNLEVGSLAAVFTSWLSFSATFWFTWLSLCCVSRGVSCSVPILGRPSVPVAAPATLVWPSPVALALVRRRAVCWSMFLVRRTVQILRIIRFWRSVGEMRLHSVTATMRSRIVHLTDEIR